MATDSKIQWTHHTFNPWRGCTKVSEGCKHCYAETQSKRNPKALGIWGANGERVIASEAYWKEPLKWERWARDGVCHVCAGDGEGEGDDGAVTCDNCHGSGKVEPYRAGVFCASLADIFEHSDTMPESSIVPVRAARVRLANLIHRTPNLNWLLLTKRTENVMPTIEQMALDCSNPNETCEMLNGWLGGNPPANVWLGTSCENQQAKHRFDEMRRCPAAIRFLSLEPLLEDLGTLNLDGIHWVIIGGESGSGARPCNVSWIRTIIEQCHAAGVACFVKQLGREVFDVPGCTHLTTGMGHNHAICDCGNSPHGSSIFGLGLNHKKGGEPSEWPAELRVREFPTLVGV